MRNKINTSEIEQFAHEALVKELNERAIDLFFAKGEATVREWVDSVLKAGTIYPDDKFSLTYTLNLIGGDIVQIVARARRIAKKKAKNAKQAA